MFQKKICRENQNTHFMFRKFFLKINHTVYVIMCKNIVEMDRPQIMCMHIACWIPKATNTHSEYVMLIALPL
jgi:hypothetical protein